MEKEKSLGLSGTAALVANSTAVSLIALVWLVQTIYLLPKERRDLQDRFIAEIREERQANRENLNTLALSLDRLADQIRELKK